MQHPNYTVVLFEKDKEDTPKYVGYLTIGKILFGQLTDNIFTTIEAEGSSWTITSRRWFQLDCSAFVQFVVVLDAVKIIPPPTIEKL